MKTEPDRAAARNVQEIYSATKNHSYPLSLLPIDADHFNSYNHALCAVAGDHALRTLAKILKSCASEGDVAVRYRGEEFMVILPLAGEADAYQVAERIRATVEETQWKQRLITLSTG